MDHMEMEEMMEPASNQGKEEQGHEMLQIKFEILKLSHSNSNDGRPIQPCQCMTLYRIVVFY